MLAFTFCFSFPLCSAAVRAQHMELKPSWLLKPQKTSAPAHFYLLKLSVFKKLRLGGLWPRFWKPRGSILEGPGSIFKGFGRLNRCLKAFLGGEHFATDLSCIIGPFAGEKWSRSCRATGHLPRMPVLPCPGSDGRGAHGVGGRRCPPPGGFQSAGHRRCANGVPNSFPTGSVQSQLANLDILSRNSI